MLLDLNQRISDLTELHVEPQRREPRRFSVPRGIEDFLRSDGKCTG
jgi:hypothetical protein